MRRYLSGFRAARMDSARSGCGARTNNVFITAPPRITAGTGTHFAPKQTAQARHE
jgi:hypothetical protein